MRFQLNLILLDQTFLEQETYYQFFSNSSSFEAFSNECFIFFFCFTNFEQILLFFIFIFYLLSNSLFLLLLDIFEKEIFEVEFIYLEVLVLLIIYLWNELLLLLKILGFVFSKEHSYI